MDLEQFESNFKVQPMVSPKGRLMRFYDVTVSDRQGNVLETFKGISAQLAGRIRNQNRKWGNRVNQIEVSNLNGEVIRYEFVPPEQHHSQVLDKPVVRENKYNPRAIKAQAKYQAHYFGKENAELRRVNNRNNNHIYVYEKIENKLRFSGTLGDAVSFIMNKMANGEWDKTDWVIYLPPKVYELVISKGM